MTAAVASLALLGVALPHVVRLDHSRPITAAVLWSAGLTLRALVAVSATLFAALVFPDTEVYKLLTHWCGHSVLPLVGLHVDVHGHVVGAAAILLPAAAIAVALGRSVLDTLRGARSVRAMLDTRSLGSGPGASVIVGGPEVAVAAAGLFRPRIVVTAGALAMLDDDELAAGLAHEEGHIARRHTLLLAYAEYCRAMAWLLPGSRRAASELRFQLERDADEWALRRHHDPRALASAICKAAGTGVPPRPTVATLGGAALERRVDRLMADSPAGAGSFARRLVDSAAVLMVMVTLSSMVAVPTEALAGGGRQVAAHSEHHCSD